MPKTHQLSKIQQIQQLPEEQRLAIFSSMTDEELLNFPHDWELFARPNQRLPQGDWFTWLILAGRGYGKTRTGAETVRYWVENNIYGRIALVAENAKDGRDVIVEGESGILATAHPHFTPLYNPSKKKVTWPNGAVAHLYAAEAYEGLRGPQFDAAWVDEIAKFQKQEEVWEQLMFSLRLRGPNGAEPRVVVTTTPRPTPLIKEIFKDANTYTTTGSTFENIQNLSAKAVAQMKEKYEGTRLGRQELYAEILDDNPSALFHQKNFDKNRVKDLPPMKRIVVAIDPATTNNVKSDMTGIIVAGIDYNGHGYVMDDKTCKKSPQGWADIAIALHNKWQADCVVAEVNQGGDMVESIIRNNDPLMRYKAVRATRGKALRAEPIAGLYEQNRIHHYGVLADCEDEMTNFDPTLGRNQDSPNRLDAVVWALTELFGVSDESDVWLMAI